MTTSATARAATLQAILRDGVEGGVAPGAAALVVCRDGRRLEAWAGHTHRDPGAAAVDGDTVFDLASLTKLLSTTLLCAVDVAAGRLRLDETPWPRWPGVTVAHALAHEAGLPDWLPFFQQVEQQLRIVGTRAAREALLGLVHDVEPVAAPGATSLYSDLGFLALGALVEERGGAALAERFATAARDLCGAEGGVRYVDLGVDGAHPALPFVASTERCPWRRRVVSGQVHDENAFAAGGVCGHAGLFGSLRQVEPLACAFLDAVVDPHSDVERALQRFAQRPGARGLGFDRVSPGGSTGDALSAETVGHLAFTGCSLWIDPARGAVFVLLTNRVFDSRDKGPIRGLRQAFHRAAAAWVDEL